MPSLANARSSALRGPAISHIVDKSMRFWPICRLSYLAHYSLFRLTNPDCFRVYEKEEKKKPLIASKIGAPWVAFSIVPLGPELLHDVGM